MQKLTLREIQLIELQLLVQFHKICQDYGWRYSLGGGSLLGAIRHKGFIPWDDDIDVMMPRPDYDAFIEFCKKEIIPFELITYDIVKGYNGPFAKIQNPSTRIIDQFIKAGYEKGICIDIFPIDGLGNSKLEAFRIFQRTAFKRELLNSISWQKYYRSKTHSLLIEPIRFLLFLLGRFVDPKKLLEKVDIENHKHSFISDKYAGCVCGSYRTKEIMKKKTFEKYIDIEFECNQLKAIDNYHEYLIKHYGDYLKLPPKEKRITHHTYEAYKL